MKSIKQIYLPLFLLLGTLAFGQVGIGTNAPNASSDLDLGGDVSSTKALLLNRVANEGVISDPANGMLIYDLSEECVKAYQNGEWSDCLWSNEPAVVIPEARGTGSLSGRTCFDVVRQYIGPECGTLDSRLAQQADFAETNTADPNYVYKQTYTFKAMGANVSNVRFTYVDPTGKVLQSLVATADYSGNNISTATAVATYKQASLNSDATGLSRNAALKADIYVVYNNSTDGTGTDVQIKLTVNVQDCACCGAYVSATKWKEFLCHNLGADITLDPHVPNVGLVGAYIQWGKRGPNVTGDSRIDWQAPTADNGPLGFAAAPTSSNSNVGAITGWSGIAAGAGAWNSGTEAVPIKTVNDPCPVGYRVPTQNEWIGVNSYNTASRTGTPWASSPTNYSTAIHFGPNTGIKGLTLPTSGLRSGTGQSFRGERGLYRTSKQATVMLFDSSAVYNYGGDDPIGYSVRCISEN